MCWATFWAIFSPNHLDSLFLDRPFILFLENGKVQFSQLKKADSD
jgi:hypothetical protein